MPKRKAENAPVDDSAKPFYFDGIQSCVIGIFTTLLPYIRLLRRSYDKILKVYCTDVFHFGRIGELYDMNIVRNLQRGSLEGSIAHDPIDGKELFAYQSAEAIRGNVQRLYDAIIDKYPDETMLETAKREVTISIGVDFGSNGVTGAKSLLKKIGFVDRIKEEAMKYLFKWLQLESYEVSNDEDVLKMFSFCAETLLEIYDEHEENVMTKDEQQQVCEKLKRQIQKGLEIEEVEEWHGDWVIMLLAKCVEKPWRKRLKRELEYTFELPEKDEKFGWRAFFQDVFAEIEQHHKKPECFDEAAPPRKKRRLCPKSVSKSESDSESDSEGDNESGSESDPKDRV